MLLNWKILALKAVYVICLCPLIPLLFYFNVNVKYTLLYFFDEKLRWGEPEIHVTSTFRENSEWVTNFLQKTEVRWIWNLRESKIKMKWNYIIVSPYKFKPNCFIQSASAYITIWHATFWKFVKCFQSEAIKN